jgi:dTDP-D-glucose 4,6-dehydratase
MALPLRTRPFVLHYHHHHHHDYSFIILIHVGIEEVYGDDDDGRQKIKESGPLKRERETCS